MTKLNSFKKKVEIKRFRSSKWIKREINRSILTKLTFIFDVFWLITIFFPPLYIIIVHLCRRSMLAKMSKFCLNWTLYRYRSETRGTWVWHFQGKYDFSSTSSLYYSSFFIHYTLYNSFINVLFYSHVLYANANLAVCKSRFAAPSTPWYFSTYLILS